MHIVRRRDFGLVAVLVAFAQVTSGSADAKETLAIRIWPAKATLLVGEPLVLSMTFTGASALEWRGLSHENRNLRVFVDRGSGFVPYAPKSWLPEPLQEPGKTKMAESRGYREETLAYDANLGDWLFPAPGTYRLMVEYQDETFGVVRSNAVSLAVRAPTGDEKTIHDALRQIGPAFLGIHQPNKLAGELEVLIERFPKSVYLQEARLMDLEHRMNHMAEAFDPDDPTGARPATREERQNLAKRLLADLLPASRALAETEGQFQPEALRLLARLQAISGDLAAQRQTLQRIVRDFPNRAAAVVAREELVGDDEDEEDAKDEPPAKSATPRR